MTAVALKIKSLFQNKSRLFGLWWKTSTLSTSGFISVRSVDRFGSAEELPGHIRARKMSVNNCCCSNRLKLIIHQSVELNVVFSSLVMKQQKTGAYH